MIDRYVVGGFYRVHAERGIDENLNAPGSQLRAARVCREPPAAARRGQAGRQRAEPFLHVRRDRAPGAWWRRATNSKPPTPTPRSRVRTPARPARPGAAALRTHVAAHNRRSNNCAGRCARCPRIGRPRRTSPNQRRNNQAPWPRSTLGALGVVYGDIGTSPLYALKEVFARRPRAADAGQHPRHAVAGVLDDDRRGVAEVRAADPARRQQRRGRPDRDAGAGLAAR